MIRYMLDTNACIGVINGSPPSLRARLQKAAPNDVAISQIVLYELEYGVCRSRNRPKNRANLTHFLKYIDVLDWSRAQSVEAARIRCDLAHKGQPIGPYDILIAAHAHSLNTILVTHNRREFGRVDGLHLEDWE